MARNVLMKEVSGVWVWGRQRLGWMDGVKVALGSRVMIVGGCTTIRCDGEVNSRAYVGD